MISIIIPNYNGKRYLRTCIDSIYSIIKVLDEQIEFIIIDNASTDSTYEWIAQQYPSIFLSN